MRFARLAFIAAAVWSLGASFVLLLSPVTIHEQRALGSANGSHVVEELTRQASWYEVQGLWGVFVVAVFALLFLAIAALAVKERYVALLGVSLLATTLVLLSGFSIGPFYLPAAVGVLLGWIGLGIGRFYRSGRGTSAASGGG